MFRRLHTQLTLFCTLITGLILILMVCVCLVISETGLRQQSRASFSSNLLSFYQELEKDSTLSFERLSQAEHNYGVVLQFTDQGVPLFYQRFSKDEDLSLLFDKARETASAQYGIDPDTGLGLQNRLLHVEFAVKSGSPTGFWNLRRPSAWASAALIPKSSGLLGIIVLQPLTALFARIWRQRLFFGAAGLFGLALLLLFSWRFTARILAPIEENRRKQTRFVAAASHELRSPLTVMLSCVSAVRNGLAPDPGTYLETVEAEGMRMSRLISDMLTLANADNHSWNIRPAPVELDTLLLQTWESFETLARLRGLSWEIRLPDEPLPPCLCDRERIVQVLEILIDNAFSYIPKGCRIRLSLDYAAQEKQPDGVFCARRQKSGRQTGSVFRICVSDNGPGIPDAQKEQVFERFHRLDNSRKDKSHFGLGLSIAKEIISLHKGTLTLEDAPGGGAAFWILLPGDCGSHALALPGNL